MKLRFILLFCLTLLFMGCQAFKEIKSVKINGDVLAVSIAKTASEMALGLGHKESLPQNQGMLFVYLDKKIRSFWMKGMQFNIDIIWINDDKVVGFVQDAPIANTNTPDASLPRYKSNQPVNYVLEVNAGWIAKNGLKIGDFVQFLY